MKKETLFRIIKKPSLFSGMVFQKLVSKEKLHWMSDKSFLKLRYKYLVGKRLNLKNPRTFNEKLQWLKLYDRNPEYCKLVDKYEVKKIISDTIGEEYVIPTLGVWDHFEDIDFNSLPDRFALKCTHDSGSVVLCHDKNTFDIEAARKKITAKLKVNPFWHGREWPYKDLNPRIIAEQYMRCENGEELIDYKFFCFGGEPEFVYVSQGLSNHAAASLSYLWMDWTRAPFYRGDFPQFDKLPDKPKTYDKMVELAKILSKDCPFARVDFYEINGKLYFGEITFYPGSGFTVYSPDGWDEKIGEWLNLPDKKV